MNIKKVDDMPMVIHTKEKPKLHVKGTPETKIKGRNADTNTQGRQGKEQEVRQSVNRENRMYAQYRKTKAEKEAADRGIGSTADNEPDENISYHGMNLC